MKALYTLPATSVRARIQPVVPEMRAEPKRTWLSELFLLLEVGTGMVACGALKDPVVNHHTIQLAVWIVQQL